MDDIGKRIKDIRKSKKITLVELAKMTNVAQASLSRIETGIMTGTVESHQKIAEALGIGLSELYEGLDSRFAQIDYGEPQKENITIVNDNIQVEILTTNASQKKIIPTVYTLRPQCETNVEKLERGVERFYWVLEGEITFIINKNEYLLKRKHSIYFDASLPHVLKNSSSSPAQVFCATSPPRI